MTPEEYLSRLREQLEGFSPEEKSRLVDEIISHIVNGEEDPSLGGDPQERQQRVMAELGSPEQMGGGFKQVHRPGRFLHFLIAFLPSLFLLPLIQPLTLLILGYFSNPEPVAIQLWLSASIRVSILVCGSLIFLSMHRRSVWLLLFWIPTTAGYIITLLSREQRLVLSGAPMSIIAESVIWFGLLSGLAMAFIRLLLQNRRNPLLITFALLPVVMFATRIIVFQLSTAMSLSTADFTSKAEFILFNELAGVAWIPLFFIPLSRQVRWLALVISAVIFLLQGSTLFGLDTLLVLLWAIPLLVVLRGWHLDQRGEHRVIFR